MSRILKAEMWDKTQYFLSNFYDRMMHYAMFFEGNLDLEIMRDAVKYVVDKVPTLRSKYVPNIVVPYWKLSENYTREELVVEEVVTDVDSSTMEFLKGDISHKDKLQFRCKIFKDGTKSSFALLVNHQCFDGSDFKYVIFKIVDCYNAIADTGSCENIEIKTGTRRLSQLYTKMSPQRAKKAKKLYNNASKMGLKKSFKFTDDKDCTKRFITKMIQKELFDKAKVKGKQFNASLNDVLLAAYFRAYVKEAGLSNDELVGITSMIDLRRHFENKASTDGCTNMTAFMPCKLKNGIGDTFEETLSRVAEFNNELKKDECVGLYGIPLLALAYKLFVFDVLARIAIKIGYENPLMQMSNLGIITDELVTFRGCKVYDYFMTGAVKYKPFFQLTCITKDGNCKLMIAEKCSDEDEKLIRTFLDDLVKELEEFTKE